MTADTTGNEELLVLERLAHEVIDAISRIREETHVRLKSVSIGAINWDDSFWDRFCEESVRMPETESTSFQLIWRELRALNQVIIRAMPALQECVDVKHGASELCRLIAGATLPGASERQSIEHAEIDLVDAFTEVQDRLARLVAAVLDCVCAQIEQEQFELAESLFGWTESIGCDGVTARDICRSLMKHRAQARLAATELVELRYMLADMEKRERMELVATLDFSGAWPHSLASVFPEMRNSQYRLFVEYMADVGVSHINWSLVRMYAEAMISKFLEDGARLDEEGSQL